MRTAGRLVTVRYIALAAWVMMLSACGGNQLSAPAMDRNGMAVSAGSTAMPSSHSGADRHEPDTGTLRPGDVSPASEPSVSQPPDPVVARPVTPHAKPASTAVRNPVTPSVKNISSSVVGFSLVDVDHALPQRFDGYGWYIRISPNPCGVLYSQTDAVPAAISEKIARYIRMPGGQPIVFYRSSRVAPVGKTARRTAAYYYASVTGNRLETSVDGISFLGKDADGRSVLGVDVAVQGVPERPAWAVSDEYRPGVLLAVDGWMPMSVLNGIAGYFERWIGKGRVDIAVNASDGRAVVPWGVVESSWTATLVAGREIAPYENLAGCHITDAARIVSDHPPKNRDAHDDAIRIKMARTELSGNPNADMLTATEIANIKRLADADPREYHEAGLAFWQNHQAWFYAEHRLKKGYARALCLSAAAVFREPVEPDYLDTLAELYYLHGRYDDAIAVINTALAQPRDRGRKIGKGKTHYLNKQRRKFEAALKKKLTGRPRP